MSLKTFFKNYLIEQDENLVSVTPEQYVETLGDVGGIADRIAKLKVTGTRFKITSRTGSL